jgi:hypothetical protein
VHPLLAHLFVLDTYTGWHSCNVLKTTRISGTTSSFVIDHWSHLFSPVSYLVLLEATLRSWHHPRRSDVGSSDTGEPCFLWRAARIDPAGWDARRDTWNMARRYEVGGLTLYSRDQLSKPKKNQNSKLILFSDARVSRRNILFARDILIHINHVMRFILWPFYLFEIPAQHSKSPLSVRNPRSASSDSSADCVTK